MSSPWADVAIIFALIALNGFFAGAELAIVSARRARLLILQESGSKGAATALALQHDQGRFLSAGQIGITLIGIANGAFSGASLSGPTAELLTNMGLATSWTIQAAYILVIIVVTYLSLVVGELVPKQWALGTPEKIACVTAPIMMMLTRILSPIVTLLDQSTALIFRLLHVNREGDRSVTEEELRHVMTEAQLAGVIEEEERELLAGIMRLADRQVRGVMTPRPEVDWIDIAASQDEIRQHLISTPHTRLVVADGSVDNIVGVLQARDALAAILSGATLDLKKLALQVPIVPDVANSTVALAKLRDAEVPLAVVVDEYGHFEGVVTPADLLTTIAGEFRSDLDAGHDPALVQREDGSWLVSGHLPADELAELLDFRLEEERDYHTVAGMALAAFEHIPETGEHFSAHGFRFEVVDMDGRRIDKLLVASLPDDEEEHA